MKSCVLIPSIKINGIEKPSKLFQDLTKIFINRKDAIEVWGLFQIPNFGDKYGLKKVNGEYLAKDIKEKLEFNKYLEDKLSKKVIEQDAGFANNKGEYTVFKDYEEAVNKAESFSENSKVYNAKIIQVDKGFAINIETKKENPIEPQNIKFNSALNRRLLQILEDVGFDVSIVKGLQQDGIFSPLNAEENAKGLIEIIKLAEDERGEKALPEEFAHLIVAGLRNQPLVRRALESLTDEQIQNVLGEQYQNYKDLYKNEQFLKEEAFGKMLADSLINVYDKTVSDAQKGLIDRIWNFIKSLFKRTNIGEVNNAISYAKDLSNELAKSILTDIDSITLSKEDIFTSDIMFRISKTSKSIEELAKKARETKALLMKEKAVKDTSGMYSDEDKKALREIDDKIKSKDYVGSCCSFLKNALHDINEFNITLNDIKGWNYKTNNEKLRTCCDSLVSLKEYTSTYEEIISEMGALNKIYSDIGITKEDAEKISEEANKILVISNGLIVNSAQLQLEFLKAFLEPYWKDKTINTKFIEDQMITVQVLLDKGFNDITFFDNTVNALSEASDILLALMAKIAIEQQDKRDEILLRDDANIRDWEQKLVASGSTSAFMNEVDENGKPTGWLISNRNSVAFERDKENYFSSLQDDESITVGDKIILKQEWIGKYTEEIEVEYNGKKYTTRVPKEKDENGNLLYGYPKGASPIDRLTPAQKEYYDKMIALKAAREVAIPEYQRSLYRAIQKRTDFVEELASKITNPKELTKACFNKMKDKIVKRVDDVEFGKVDHGKYVLLNAQGKPVKRIPAFYIDPLEDMSQLSMDFGGSMRAFCATMVNYSMMNQILPQMELLNDTIQERDVTMTSGSNPLKAFKKILGQEIEQEYTEKGKNLRVGKAANFLMDKFFYGINKKEGKEIQIKNAQIDSEKLLDLIKEYTSLVGMGFNLYSGISNITMGGVQMLIEARGGEYFKTKDLAKAHILYDKNIVGYLGEINSLKRENKLSLLIDKFDALESFYDNLKNKPVYKNSTMRGMQNMSVMIFNEIGEHRLHSVTMLAMLNNYKLKQGDQEISLYDALEVSKERVDKDGKKFTSPPYLKIMDGVTKLDGTEFTQDDFIAMKRKISRVNRRMHGAYSEAFKGRIHETAAGRLVMQFRQWMPGFYSNRFAGIFSGGSYYDVELGDNEEGYYVTAGKLIIALAKDIKKLKFQMATNFDNLTPHQKANMRKFAAETKFAVVLGILCSLMGGWKDKDSTWTEKMLYYQMLRLRLEVGAGCPLNPKFMGNIWTMMQSPAAAIKSCNNITDLLMFWNLCNEIQTGRYAGHSRYFRDFIETLPLYGQVRKVIDLKEDNYMFNIFD